jgi:signal peptidase
MRKLIARAAGAVAVATVGLAVLVLAGTFIPTLLGFQTFIVASGSMGRTMPIGSVALTRPIEAQALSVGDVVTFRHQAGATTTHRVVAIKHDGAQVILTTKGDANGSADPEPVVLNARIHRVEYVVPYVGYFVRYARSPLGGIMLFLIPILGLTLEGPIRRARRRHKHSHDADDAGWSWTTFAFEQLTERSLRSHPGS